MNIKRAITILTLIGCYGSAAAVNVTFNFGAGFADATPVAPVGGNTGTTLGQQRQILFQAAAQVWGDLIDSSVDIVVDAQFAPDSCDAMSATLGSAGPTFLHTGGPPLVPNTFYPRSLLDALTGTDNHFGESDIEADFNSNVDDGLCLGGATFYYGLDGNNPGGTILLFPVVLHEIAHGLGFTSVVNEADGTFPAGGIPSIFDLFIFDVEANEYWTDMTNAERLTSLTNDPEVVWDGINVTDNAATFTTSGFRDGSLRLHAPGTFEPGSSIAHFTTAASPNLVMEPILANDVAFNQTDVTPFLFQDLGYTLIGSGAPLIFKSGFEDGE